MVTRVLSFLVGILSAQQLATLPGTTWLLTALVGLGVFITLRRWQGVFFLIGFLWAAAFASHRLDSRLPEALAGRDIQIKGIIADLPKQESSHTRFNFTVTEASDKIPDLLRLTWYYPEQALKAGQEWAFTVRLRPPHGNFNPGGFDYERWLFVEGIGASGYIRAKPAPKQLTNGTPKLSLAAGRQYIAEQLDSLLANSPSLPMVKALTIGDGDSLTPEQWEVFRLTGTTHLMVISGSHIGLIAGLAYLLVVRLWARTGILAWSPQQIAASIAAITAILYAGLTGFSVPAQRAALMVAVAMLAIIQQRNSRPYPLLALALLAVLMIDPLVVLLPGFWLSFIAVSLIIYVLAGRLEKPRFIRGSLKINWVTSLGLTPLVLLFFQQVSLIAPLANLIAVPVIGLVVVPLALLATVVMFLSPLLATKLFFVVDIILDGLWRLLVQLTTLPLSTISHPQPSWWALAFALPGMAVLFAPKGMPARWLGLVMLFPLVFSASVRLNAGAFKLTLLDVGQGLSAVIKTANHVLVYDTGAKFSTTSDSGQSVIIPYLRSQDVDKIDTLIISHGDNDHIGGTDSLLKTIATNQVLTSVPELLSQYAPAKCNSGQAWEWDNVRFSILSPRPNILMSENDNSCVLHVQGKHGSALLTGDIEVEAESWLVDTYQNKLKADILFAPHHGSQTSSTSRFLNTVKPKLVLIPAGYRNPFGHPHEDVLARYQSLHLNWLNSADEGAIDVDVSQHLSVQSWRQHEGKHWNFKK